MEMGSVSVNQQVQEDNVANIPDSMVTPKSKFIWTTEFNSSFMREVINLGGIEKAKPAKILNAMNVPGLKRANVASHLQKGRELVRKGEYMRFSKLPRNHLHFTQCQRCQQNLPASCNTEGSHHASYNREGEKLPGDPDDFVSVQGWDQENVFFGGLTQILNPSGYSTTVGQDNPMPLFSAYATNQETAVQTQFVPPTPATALPTTNSSYHASYNREAEKLQTGAGDFVLPQGWDQENVFFAGLNPILNHFDYNTAGHEMQLFSAYATNQETAVQMQFVPQTPLSSPTQLDDHYDFASKSWKW